MHGSPSVARIVRLGGRVTGAFQVLLGLAFWAGYLGSLVLVHIGVGILLGLLLWGAAGLGARAGASRVRVAVAVLWVPLMVLLGLRQEGILPGGSHWLVQVLHLVVGLAAIAQIEVLTRSVEP